MCFQTKIVRKRAWCQLVKDCSRSLTITEYQDLWTLSLRFTGWTSNKIWKMHYPGLFPQHVFRIQMTMALIRFSSQVASRTAETSNTWARGRVRHNQTSRKWKSANSVWVALQSNSKSWENLQTRDCRRVNAKLPNNRNRINNKPCSKSNSKSTTWMNKCKKTAIT